MSNIIKRSKKIYKGNKEFENDRANKILEMRQLLSEPDTEDVLLFVKKKGSNAVTALLIGDEDVRINCALALAEDCSTEMRTTLMFKIRESLMDEMENDTED